jgi:hypothetical protein
VGHKLSEFRRTEGCWVTEAERYRQKSDELLRQAVKADNLNERGRLISQAVHFNELALAAAKKAVEQRRARAAVVPFRPDPGAPKAP